MSLSANKRENVIYLIIWLMVMSLPVFTLRGADEFDWNRVFMEWLRLTPFFLIFVINNSLLIPKLYYRKRTWQYVLSVFMLIMLVSFLSDNLRILNELFSPHRMPPPPPPHVKGGPQPMVQHMIETIFISFLVVGFNMAVKLVFQRQKEEHTLKEREKIHLQTELSLLRQQISPHFFMNTLNNIHALVDFDTELAKSSIVQLSKLMRYLLEDSNRGKATIKEEFDFLGSYIDLMRLRCSEKVNIQVDLNIVENKIRIPPLLFVSLVENAFKYGVNTSVPSFIFIDSKIENNYLHFDVKNSKTVTTSSESGTGLGLENLRKQLDLIFGSNYTFTISEDENEFNVHLEIPLNND